jgi:molybdenum cofactor biosynthesis enzyme MoaA
MATGGLPYQAWLNWVVNDKCNFFCPYCVAGNSWKYGDYHSIDVQRVLQTLSRDGRTFLVRFTGGGEPFLVSNLVEVCVELTKAHYIGFNTNLISKRVEHLMQQVDPSRIHDVVASLHFSELERQGLVNRFLNHAHLLLSKGVNVSFMGVAYPGFRDKIKSYLEFYKSHGIPVTMFPYVGTYEGKVYPDSYTPEEIEMFALSAVTANRHFVPQILRDVALNEMRLRGTA